MANVNISDKNTGDQHTAAEFNTIKNFINTPIVALGTLDPANVVFAANGYYSQYTQAGAVVFNVPASVVDGIGQVLYFISDGTNTISFNSSKFHITTGIYGITNGGTLAAGLWKIWLFSENGKINVNVPAEVPADVSGPTIVSGTFASDNSYIDVIFNEGVYGADDGGTPCDLADFTLVFDQAGGAATAWTASSAKQNDAATEGAASALAGGETTIRIFGAATGTADGNETLTITPVDGASIYDVGGNAMLGTETTGAVNLNSAALERSIEFVNASSQFLDSLARIANIEFSDGVTDQPFSIGIWCKLNSIAADQKLIFYGANDSTNPCFEIRIITETSGSVPNRIAPELYDNSFGSSIICRSGTGRVITRGAWTHIVFTYDGTGLLGTDIYVNAVHDTAPTRTGGYVAMSAGSANHRLYIGKSMEVGIENHVDGLIDEVTIWDKVLNASEVTELYGGGTPIDATAHSAAANLVDYRKFNNSLIDSSGLSNSDLQINNGASYNADVP